MAAVNEPLGLESMTLEERRTLARNCFGCGSHNPHGLRLTFEPTQQQVRARFMPQPEHEGFPGVLHGGIVFTLMDEAMGWATYARGIMAFSAKIETRFRKTISIDWPLQVVGELVKDRGRLLQMRAEIRSEEGELLADAEGVFVRVPEEALQALERARASLIGALQPERSEK
jgi:acyl-coenzyme A thioesterase PaaI-like protein